MSKAQLIQEAHFNPKIQQYILWSGAGILFLTVIGIPLLLLWLLGIGQYVGKRFYENLFCTLTTRNLSFKKGVLFKVEKTIPLENIQDLTFIENPLLNYLDLKILKIETAGNSNPQGSDMKLIGIRNAAAFRDLVLEQREILRDSIQDQKSTDGDAEEVPKLLAEIRDILLEMRARDKNSTENR